jgi:hypothetical protein
MKVMLDEIARKKEEEVHARLELELRRKEGDRIPEPPPESKFPPGAAPTGGRPPRGG